MQTLKIFVPVYSSIVFVKMCLIKYVLMWSIMHETLNVYLLFFIVFPFSRWFDMPAILYDVDWLLKKKKKIAFILAAKCVLHQTRFFYDSWFAFKYVNVHWILCIFVTLLLWDCYKWHYDKQATSYNNSRQKKLKKKNINKKKLHIADELTLKKLRYFNFNVWKFFIGVEL